MDEIYFQVKEAPRVEFNIGKKDDGYLKRFNFLEGKVGLYHPKVLDWCRNFKDLHKNTEFVDESLDGKNDLFRKDSVFSRTIPQYPFHFDKDINVEKLLKNTTPLVFYERGEESDYSIALFDKGDVLQEVSTDLDGFEKDFAMLSIFETMAKGYYDKIPIKAYDLDMKKDSINQRVKNINDVNNTSVGYHPEYPLLTD